MGLAGRDRVLRVGTWNLAGRWSAGHRDFIEGAGCDVWLLTEVPGAFSLGDGHLVRSEVMGRTAGRSWAAVWSARPLEPLASPHEAAAFARRGPRHDAGPLGSCPGSSGGRTLDPHGHSGERCEVPKASRASAPQTVQIEGYEGHIEELEGGYTVAFERYSADFDLAPFFSGLPDDRCQCPHWGYVVKGKVTFRFSDREETYEAGDAYYAPPGHTPVLFDGSEIIEFSDTRELRRTMETVMRNMEAAGR